jgi:hypothetical protein
MLRRFTFGRHASLLAGLVLVGAVSSACSSSSSTTATTVSAATKTILEARGVLCTLITPADIKATTGESVTQPRVGIHGSQTTCNYKAPVLASSIVTQFDSGVTPASFQTFRSKASSTFGQTTPVVGLTVGAFSFGASVGSGTLNSVVALVGSTQVMITGTCLVSQLEMLTSTMVSQLPASAPTNSTLPKEPAG